MSILLSSEFSWAVARGTGVAALVLFTVSVALGLMTAGRRRLPGVPAFALTLVHRNVALLSTVFIGLHVVTLLLDSYAKLSLVDVVVPFISSAADAFWVGCGTVALDLLAAIVITSLLRHRVGPRVFRAVHWSTYALWPIAVLHGLGSGTDAGSAWFTVVTVVCVALVAAAAAARFAASPHSHTPEADLTAPLTLEVTR